MMLKHSSVVLNGVLLMPLKCSFYLTAYIDIDHALSPDPGFSSLASQAHSPLTLVPRHRGKVVAAFSGIPSVTCGAPHVLPLDSHWLHFCPATWLYVLFQSAPVFPQA